MEPETLPLSTPFVKKRQNVIHTTLYGFSGPFQALQADIAYISFLARWAVNPKFCLLFVVYLLSNENKKSFSKKDRTIS